MTHPEDYPLPLLTTFAETSAVVRECSSTGANWLIVADTPPGRVAIAELGMLLILRGVPCDEIQHAQFRHLDPRTAAKSDIDFLAFPRRLVSANLLRSLLRSARVRRIPPLYGKRWMLVIDAESAHDDRLPRILDGMRRGRGRTVGNPAAN
jgi:hypothetical protein